ADGLRWGVDGPSPVVADARLAIEGTLEAWAVEGTARLVRDALAATVQLDGRGDRAGITLQGLQARTPAGALDARGRLDWTPALGWQLDAALAGFDPGYFLPDWDGAVNGRVRSRGGMRADGGVDA